MQLENNDIYKSVVLTISSFPDKFKESAKVVELVGEGTVFNGIPKQIEFYKNVK